ncbi:hypothetical protein Tco_0837208, partial [Tanacetum coccineum]
TQTSPVKDRSSWEIHVDDIGKSVSNLVRGSKQGRRNSYRRAATDGEYWVATSVLDSQQRIRVNESATVLETVSFTQFENMTITMVQEKSNSL